MATPEETIESAEKDRNVSRQQLLVVAGAAVLLLVAVWFLFLRGGSEPEPAGQPEAPSSAPAQVDKDKAKDKKSEKGKKAAPKSGGSGPVENFEVFAPRDPFEPLVSSSAGGGGGTTGGTDDTGQTTGDTDGGGGSEEVGGHTVRLVDIFTGDGGEQQAQVQVDATVYRVSEGDVFADSFQLVSIEGQCATMLFGDDQFSLCEGEEILK